MVSDSLELIYHSVYDELCERFKEYYHLIWFKKVGKLTNENVPKSCRHGEFSIVVYIKGTMHCHVEICKHGLITWNVDANYEDPECINKICKRILDQMMVNDFEYVYYDEVGMVSPREYNSGDCKMVYGDPEYVKQMDKNNNTYYEQKDYKITVTTYLVEKLKKHFSKKYYFEQSMSTIYVHYIDRWVLTITVHDCYIVCGTKEIYHANPDYFAELCEKFKELLPDLE